MEKSYKNLKELLEEQFKKYQMDKETFGENATTTMLTRGMLFGVQLAWHAIATDTPIETRERMRELIRDTQQNLF